VLRNLFKYVAYDYWYTVDKVSNFGQKWIEFTRKLCYSKDDRAMRAI